MTDKYPIQITRNDVTIEITKEKTYDSIDFVRMRIYKTGNGMSWAMSVTIHEGAVLLLKQFFKEFSDDNNS